MEPESPLPHLQMLATCPYPEPSNYAYVIKIPED
jgi:hypothetical protein